MLCFSCHRCSCSASWHHGETVQDMGGAWNGEVFGSSPLSQVRIRKLHSFLSDHFPGSDVTDRSTWTDNILSKRIQFLVRYGSAIIFGASNVSRLLAALGLSIHATASLNLTIWWRKEDENIVQVSLVVACIWPMVLFTLFTGCKMPIEREIGCNHMTVSPDSYSIAIAVCLTSLCQLPY